jgi:hypothetical protein
LEEIIYPIAYSASATLIAQYPTLNKNRNNTLALLQSFNAELNRLFLDTSGFCIAIAGSYGRLEASKLSDADFFILYDDTLTPEQAKAFHVQASAVAKKLNIQESNPDGVFASASRLSTLIQNIGDRDDQTRYLGQRMLLLMESQPLYNKDFFQQSVTDILDKYCDYVKKKPHKQFVVLMNEVIKYFRTICLNYQCSFWRENEKWTIRNLKLRHSRVIMYAGLLLLILNASKYGVDKYSYLKSHIYATPLEKVLHVYNDNGREPVKLLLCYERFVSMMNDENIRGGLCGLDYNERYDNPKYEELKSNSDELCKELTTFIFSMRTIWADTVFEYLLF